MNGRAEWGHDLIAGMREWETGVREEAARSRFERRLEEEFGDSARGLEMEFDLRNHYIEGRLVERMEGLQTGVLLGEMGTGHVAAALVFNEEEYDWEEYDQARAEHSGVNGPRESAIEHVRLVRQLLERGMVFWETDAGTRVILDRTPSVVDEGLVRTGVFYSPYLLSLGVVVGVGANKNISRRGFLQLTTLLAGAVGSLGVIGSFRAGGELVPRVQAALDRELTDPEFLVFEEAVTLLRNRVMALNTWQVVEQGLGQQQRLMFFAGNGHGAVDELLLLGPAELENQVRWYAQRLVNETFDLVIHQDLDDEEVIEVLGSYGGLFSQPNNYGSQRQRLSVSGRVLNAKAVLVEEIVNRRRELAATTRRRRLLEGWLWAEMTGLYSAEVIDDGWVKDWFDQERFGQLEGVGMVRAESIQRLVSFDQVDPQRSFWLGAPATGCLVGMAIVGGRVTPVVRQFRLQGESRVMGRDCLMVNLGELLLMEEKEPLVYQPTTSESVSRSLPTELVHLEVTGEEVGDGSLTYWESMPAENVERFSYFRRRRAVGDDFPEWLAVYRVE